MRPSDDRLRAALRAEADRHRPDRDAMLDRITLAAMQDTGHGRRRAVLPGGRRGPRVRVAAVVAAVVTVFGGGGVGTWALAGADDRDEAIPVPSVAPATTTASPVSTDPVSIAPSLPATGSPAESPAGRPTPSRTTSAATPSPSLTKGQPGFTRVSQGPLWSDGSVDPDSGDTQGASVVTLKTTEELTALEVVIRVARTDGLVSRGGTKQVPGGSVSTTVTEEAGALLYRFTLSSADRLAPGTYTFTAKYTHPSGGRNAGGDTYEAIATAGGSALDVYGNFFPTN
ncbi:hypothetical protein Q0Z83_103170 [Actinoplanes sichuanensis]|uniref:Uncharacterized protein n=1 Tax=Actinoplanes sichuanensis TaxID=512349 RepID=A0ABW4AIZ6_9ACTN|nr:hypothetical protein [Actinoplanes sichuanensis]BEL12126.1 hypothetical protein Q0Z83_103170 [Actinoplanes sichuanensis]